MGRKLLKILPLSDLHYGNPTFNEDLFNKWLDVAKNSRHKIIILNGDLVELLDANRFYKNKDYVNVNEQLDYVIDNLKPFKKDIVCNLNGNHGTRTVKQYDFDTDKVIGDALDVETTKSFHEDITVQKGRYPVKIRVFAQHHAPTSKSVLLAMRRFINDMESVDAELFIGGHNHMSLTISKIYRSLNYTPIRKTYCFSGCFLNFKGSYVDNGRYSLSVPTCTALTVDKWKNVNHRIYWADNYGE